MVAKKQDNKEYWFKAKQFGWGWGLPANRKGMLSYGVFVAVWLSALAWLASQQRDIETDPTMSSVIFGIVILLDIAGLLYVSIKHGEPPKWRWGKKRGAAKS